MRKISFIILFLFLIISCQDVKKMDKPEDLIPEAKMVNVLTEMSLLQGARSYSKQELERRGIKPDEYLWEKYDIDSSQFNRSSDYYATNYVAYQRIYEKVRDSLEQLKSRFDSIREEEERVRDSIRKEQRERRDSLNEIRRQEGLDSLPEEDTIDLRRDSLVPSLSTGASFNEEIRRDSLP